MALLAEGGRSRERNGNTLPVRNADPEFSTRLLVEVLVTDDQINAPQADFGKSFLDGQGQHEGHRRCEVIDVSAHHSIQREPHAVGNAGDAVDHVDRDRCISQPLLVVRAFNDMLIPIGMDFEPPVCTRDVPVELIHRPDGP